MSERQPFDESKLVEVMFIRDDCFYFVSIMPGTAEEHALLNPGTVRVESTDGKVLWQQKH